jgi:hypothetical protein
MTLRNFPIAILGFFALFAVALPAAAAESILQNDAIRFRVDLRDGKLAVKEFQNRLTQTTVSLPLDEFLLEFQDGTKLDAGQCAARVAVADGQNLELLFAPTSPELAGIEIRVRYALPGQKPYLRKQIGVRQDGGAARRLLRADLENWQGVRRNWQSMHADRYPYGSHPIYCEDLWAGIEFVAAFNEYSHSGFVLRSRPGGRRLGRQWLDLHATVVGAAERNQVREAFLRYIDDVRLAPPRMTWCYNSWWTLAERFRSDDLTSLANEWKRRLFDRHGVFFDVLAVDAGWSDLQSIWHLDRKAFPEGFGPVRRIVESAGGRLGLWISPSAIYTIALDPAWARRSGLAIAKKAEAWGGETLGVSLADPVYRAKTEEQLCRLIRENHIAHVKFDGLIPFEDAPHHDLLPGLDSIEPLAEHAVALMLAAKRCNPDLVTEPTFLNSWSCYISPWILKYADTVYGNAGGDYPRAIGPAPDYRESCTNAREWYVFASLGEVWLPQNALQYFDIVHCDAAEGLANHVAMAVGRGRFFVPVYVNPKYVSDEGMAVLAGLMRWARANEPILRNTVILPSRPERGEPYAYAHWLDKRGLIAVRNPSNESRSYLLDLRAAGAPGDLADAVCYTQYPYRHGLAAGVAGASKLRIALGPWELLFVEIRPRRQLVEPVAVGARWYRDAQGKMRVAQDAGVEQVEVIESGGATRNIPVAAQPASVPSGKAVSQVVAPLLEKDWLRTTVTARYPAASVPSCRYEFDCQVSVPTAATQGSVLLLLQFPGKRHLPSTCAATVNGRAAELESRTSDKPLGYPEGMHMFDPKSPWAGLIPYASEWTWYICPVGPGESRVHFAGTAGLAKLKVAAWVWSECDRSVAPSSFDVDLPCPAPQMPQIAEQFERQGVQLITPARK